MESMIILTVIVVAFIALAIAATVWGSDSREPMLDDHRR